MAPAPDLDTSRRNLALELAPYLVGALLNWGLLGCLSVQVYLYTLSNGSDKWGLKTLVYTVYTIDVVQTGFATYNAWLQLIWSPGGYGSLLDFAWSFSVAQISAGMVSCTVQCFFARRIWILKRTWIMRRIVVCIVALAVAQCAGAIIFTALRIDSNMPPIFLRQMVAPIIWLAGSFLCDLLIVGSMLHLLSEARSQTSIKSTESILTKLIILTLQTGFITALVAGIQLTIYLLRNGHAMLPNQYDYASMFMLGKLYSNVLMATLNARVVVSAAVLDEVDSAPAKSSQGMAFRLNLTDLSQTTGPHSAMEAVAGANEEHDVTTPQEQRDTE